MTFYSQGTRGTSRFHPDMNVEEACIKLNAAMEGLGTDERTMNDVLLSFSSMQRQEIKRKYREIYDRDLVRQIESELTFSYEQIVMAMMTDPQEYILDCIHEAVTLSFGEAIVKKIQKATIRKGIAADEYTLLGLLVPRPNSELVQLKEAYKKKYKKHLESRIAKSENLSLDFRRLIIAMIDGKRDERANLDGDVIFKDVMTLVSGKKEEHFHVVFHERSFDHLRKLFAGYEDLTGKPIETMVENSNFSLDLKESYIALLTIIRNQAEFFAETLHNAIEGAGTNDDALILVFVLRSEVDMIDIIQEYKNKYGVSLAHDIQGDTSGDYQDLLLKMLKVPADVREECEANAQDAEEEDNEENSDSE